MPLRLQDGTGKSYEAKVDSLNRLAVKSDTVDIEMEAAEKGESFALYGKCLLAVTAATSGLIFLKNTSAIKAVHPTRVFINSEDIGQKVYLEFRKNPIIDTTDTGDSVDGINKAFSSAKNADILGGISSTTNLEFSTLGTLLHKMVVMPDSNMMMDLKGAIKLDQNNIFGIRWVAHTLGNPTDSKVVNFTINFVTEDI